MVGRTEEELLATTFPAITHPEDLHLHEGKTQMMLAGEIHHYSLEKRYLRKDGEIVWVNITVSPPGAEKHPAECRGRGYYGSQANGRGNPCPFDHRSTHGAAQQKGLLISCGTAVKIIGQE
jgi:PAS domain S-box-containing protein